MRRKFCRFVYMAGVRLHYTNTLETINYNSRTSAWKLDIRFSYEVSLWACGGFLLLYYPAEHNEVMYCSLVQIAKDERLTCGELAQPTLKLALT